MVAPVADGDAEGRLHLIWHDLFGQLWYATLAHIGAKPRVEMFGQGRQPAMLVTPEKVLVVFETPYGHLNWHSLDRRTRRWTPSEPLTVTNKWLTSDQIHSPALTQDRHGSSRTIRAAAHSRRGGSATGGAKSPTDRESSIDHLTLISISYRSAVCVSRSDHLTSHQISDC